MHSVEMRLICIHVEVKHGCFKPKCHISHNVQLISSFVQRTAQTSIRISPKLVDNAKFNCQDNGGHF